MIMPYLLRLAIALLTFSLSLFLASVLKVEFPPPTITNCNFVRQYKLIRAGKAETKEQVPFSFSAYESSDGVRFHHWTEFYGSPEAAGRALQGRIEKSTVISREPVLDANWKQLGERFLIQSPPLYPNHDKAAVLLWTHGSKLTFIQSSSLEDVLEFEKGSKR
jgi:hypothetical protein